MVRDVVILLVEDDEGHASLTIQNLRASGVENNILHLRNGQEALDFLYQRGDGMIRREGTSYIMILDLRMPMVDGAEIINKVKQDSILNGIPIIVLSTTDDPNEIEHCYKLGCVKYVVKPVRYDKFTAAIKSLGEYILKDIIPCLPSRNI